MNRLHLALGLAVALAGGPAWADEDISKVNGRIVAEAGRQYGDLDTVNGSIEIGEGAKVREAQTVNGGISVGAHAQTRGLSTVNGSINVGAQAIVDGGIETVNGGVFIDRGSEVRGGLETVNGSIGLVDTRLQGGIETVSGDITVGVGSHVTGDIAIRKPGFSLSFKPARKPRVVIGPNAVVDGSLEFEREVTLYVHRTAKVGSVSGATAQTFDSEVAPGD
ncbi:MAG: hypothetical protein ABN502_08140 [Gammaproteobacteria bacterium]|uniref:hypothetical protein n=1 Tax=Xanthomonas boreopolis TaxID=86183 RepID=UPI0032DD4313